jgi:hypothetical protein
MFQKTTIANTTLTLANTEYEYAIPAGTRKIMLSARNAGGDIKFAFTTGLSGTTYMTILAGGTWSVDGVYLRGQSLFMQSPTAGVVVEALTFQDN